MNGTLVDLSHTVEPEMPRFSAFEPPIIRPFWTHEESARSGRYQGCTCEVTEVRFVTSLGTYLDAPYHFDPHGADISELSLEQCVLPGACVDFQTEARAETALPVEVLEGLDLRGRAVLLCTGWSHHWGSDAYYQHPFVSRQMVEVLLADGVRLVGIDTLIIDSPQDPTRPAHAGLLPRGVLILENLTNLDRLTGKEFTLVAAPVKVKGAAAFPLRAFAII
jgi:arylformamidase